MPLFSILTHFTTFVDSYCQLEDAASYRTIPCSTTQFRG